jgi:DNA invertase Pin-like site-specific DNA recombinase
MDGLRHDMMQDGHLGHLIGYARTSTTDQRAGLEAQLRDLSAAGCRKVFREQVSSVAARAQLEAALDYCRDGDTLVVTKLDRLARSARHLSELVDKLEAKGVTLRILNFGGDAVDTRGATGRLMLNMFAAMAQFEREMMLERQREGIAKAKADGKYKGRKPTARLKAEDAARMFRDGKRVARIAKDLGIGRGSVYRALEAAGLKEKNSDRAGSPIPT